MDLIRAIRELQDEKKRLDKVIASLEELLTRDDLPASSSKEPKKAGRRGRKTMSAEERERVSQRMANYWAAKRAKLSQGATGG